MVLSGSAYNLSTVHCFRSMQLILPVPACQRSVFLIWNFSSAMEPIYSHFIDMLILRTNFFQVLTNNLLVTAAARLQPVVEQLLFGRKLADAL